MSDGSSDDSNKKGGADPAVSGVQATTEEGSASKSFKDEDKEGINFVMSYAGWLMYVYKQCGKIVAGEKLEDGDPLIKVSKESAQKILEALKGYVEEFSELVRE